MLSEEEKKAIKMMEIIVDECKLENKRKGYEGTYYDGDIPIPYKEYETVLNLVTKSEKEITKYKNMYEAEHDIHNTRNEQLDRKERGIQKAKQLLLEKDKQIDLMIEEYEYNARINFKNFCEDELRKDNCIQDCKTCAKKYFEKLAKEKGE